MTTEEIRSDEEQEKAALWNEFEKADSGDADPSDGAADKAAASEDAAPEEAKSDDKPDSAAAEGDKPEAAEQSADEKPADAKADPWASAPPELKAEYEKLQEDNKRLTHLERSHRGRLSWAQRKLNEAQGQPAKSAPKEAATAAKKQPFGSDKGKEFVKEYPEVAAPVAEELAEVRQEVDELKAARRREEEDRQKAFIEEQTTLLDDEHSDWRTVLKDANGEPRPEFVAWLNDQPRHIKEAATRNANGIVDYEEAGDVIARYKAHRAASQPDAAQPSTQQPALSGKRQRQLESAAAARTRGPGAVSGIPPEDASPEQHWKYFEEQERRANRGA